MLAWKQKLVLTAGLRMEETWRGGDSLEQLRLVSLLVDVGVSAEVVQNLEVMMGVKLFQARGNEYLTERNKYGELVDLPIYLVNETHGIYAAGVRYNFRDDIYLQLAGNWINVHDRNGALPKYQIQRFLLVFNMNL
jgi:hypothetical protein